jgi:hypothetical protein
VAGVELYNNTALQHKANDETDDATTCRIFEKKLFENEEYSERTVAGVNSTTTQRRKDDRKNNNGK